MSYVASISQEDILCFFTTENLFVLVTNLFTRWCEVYILLSACIQHIAAILKTVFHPLGLPQNTPK
ncbi:hypothetical protein PR048_016035 [Dryococelus australis]|uniref:Uncharacterized protein n=1 Tax=Dryococelus australis TaxID=614101 RepID=A0ABQ9HIL8_9NEOP|nr:hypothetical protein PR048_016035 [Dryococelus australis]